MAGDVAWCKHWIAGWPNERCNLPASIAVVDGSGDRSLFCRKHFLEALAFYLYDGPNETITVGPVDELP